jgi:hypothetical protein
LIDGIVTFAGLVKPAGSAHILERL